MTDFGWFASLEEFSPDECLHQVDLAQQYGFDSVWVNDHYHPWFDHKEDGSPANGGNCWSWMPAALERTDDLVIGTGVSAIIHRYHPANVAHRLATLAEMYPDRVFLGLGLGEALNESPLGKSLPEPGERLKRTAEAIRIITRLFEEEFVDFDGNFWQIDGANLYSGPSECPPIHVATYSPNAARMAGHLADGFTTVYEDPEYIQEELFPAVERGVERDPEKESLDDVEKTVHIHVSLADTLDEALEPCLPWRGALVDRFYEDDVADPRVIQAAGEEEVDPEQLKDEYVVTTDPRDIYDATETYVEAGFDHVVYQSHSPDQERLTRYVRDEIMPAFQ